MIDEFTYLWIHLIDEFMYNRGLTFHTGNNHTVRIDLPGEFLPQHDGHWQILEHVMWCLFLWLFFLGENSMPSNFHLIVPHNERIFANQNFGCTYTDIPKQYHLLLLIWNLMMNIVVVYWLLSQKQEFDVYFLLQD